jgi:signal transduction histidine kinase
LTEEAIISDDVQCLIDALERQEAWSDLPVVILMQGGVTSPVATDVLRSLRNVTLLERPAPTRSVVSALQAAVRGRQRQYQIRDQIEAIRLAQVERQQLLESERSARQESERAGHMKDEFLATLSHELRTPLHAIFGWTQLIKMSDDDPRTIAEGIEVIDRNVRAQTQLIEDLLDMSRIISGKVRLDLQRVNLTEVINAAIASVMPAATAKGIRLEKVADPAANSVSGDPGRLQQVLWNLLTNAIKFTPAGGTVHMLAQRVQSHIEISVRDTGDGITAEFLPKLFERFTQADGSLRRKHGGLGLGLSIVKTLVEMHGGSIRADSPGEGQGATFTIALPLRVINFDEELPPRLANARIDGKDTKLDGLKVLVVDDEPDARDLLKRFLIECGAIPKSAGSAAEAQSMLGAFDPDVIVSDIGMPGEDGYQFMRAVRDRGVKTPAVALTAFARPEDRIRSVQAGYQTHLPKPIEPVELAAVLAGLTGRY